MGSRTLINQLKHAICDCKAFGESKRAEKMNKKSDANKYKEYSYAQKKDLLGLAKDLSNYLNGNARHKLVKDIQTEDIQRFLDEKAKTNRNVSLKKLKSQLEKLENICRHTYKCNFAWNMDELLVPASMMPAGKLRNKSMTLELAEEIATTMKAQSKSEAYISPLLSTYLGLRVEETALIRAKAVRLSGGEFGLGEVAITDNIAKGGRDRIIPIIDAKTRAFLGNLIAEKDPMDFLLAKKDGEHMQTHNITRQFRKALVAMGLDKEYANTKNHAIRKGFAQRFYDMIRKTKGKTAAIEATNRILGHGAQRSVQELSVYVANIW